METNRPTKTTFSAFMQKFIGATVLLLCLGILPARAQALVSTTCGYQVTTAIAYNTPTTGQTTVTWTVVNTNPGNGNNGTFKNLGHFDIEYNSCHTDEARISGGSYGPDPSQTCNTGDVLKFDSGTTGSTPRVYQAVFTGVNYAPILVDAVFKAGNSCCSGQVYGLGCCTSASLLGTNVTGSIKFGGGSTNYYNSNNGFVPAGCNNSAQGSATVTITNPNNEFCFQDGANTDNSNLTGNTLTFTDVSAGGGLSILLTYQFAPGLVTDVTETSDNFLNGGISYSLANDILTLSVPEFSSGGNFSATYSFTTCAGSAARFVTVPEPAGNGNQGVGGLVGSSPSAPAGNIVYLHPNPNTGAFSVTLPQFKDQAEIRVTNVQGQTILKKLVSEQDPHVVKLQLDHAASGMYFVEVSFNNQHTRTRMTVK